MSSGVNPGYKQPEPLKAAWGMVVPHLADSPRKRARGRL